MVRLAPRWSRRLVLGGASLVTAVWLSLFVFASLDPSLKPHQRRISQFITGPFAVACVVALARLALRGEVRVDVDRNPVEPGQDLRVVVTPTADARLVSLRARGRGVEDRVVDLPVVEGLVRVPPGAATSVYGELRWCVEVGREQFPLLVGEPIRYSPPPR